MWHSKIACLGFVNFLLNTFLLHILSDLAISKVQRLAMLLKVSCLRDILFFYQLLLSPENLCQLCLFLSTLLSLSSVLCIYPGAVRFYVLLNTCVDLTSII